MKIVRYKVKGVGRFPIDMLRYDASWPSTERDSSIIEHSLIDRAIGAPVCLETYSKGPTKGRWESFLWEVTEIGKS